MTAIETGPDKLSNSWGPISGYVAENLLRLRTARGMSTTRLSAAVKEIGQPIPATGITRIEKGERRVNADDLVALAVALQVSPLALLLPPSIVGEVQLAEQKSAQAVSAWLWAMGRQPLELPKDDEARSAARDDYQFHSLPVGLCELAGLRAEREQHEFRRFLGTLDVRRN